MSDHPEKMVEYYERKEQEKEAELAEIEPRPEVQWFAKRMERKLQINDHKPHWSKCHMDYLIHRLYNEADELWAALRNKESVENIIDEAADVANFAMMIADNAERVTAE